MVLLQRDHSKNRTALFSTFWTPVSLDQKYTNFPLEPSKCNRYSLIEPKFGKRPAIGETNELGENLRKIENLLWTRLAAVLTQSF